MFDCFTNKPNTDFKFTAKKNLIPLDEMNKQPSALKGASLKFTEQSIKYAFNQIDQGHDAVLNRIIWFSTRGATPYPTKFEGKDEEDDED
jgi:hypothetical protein